LFRRILLFISILVLLICFAVLQAEPEDLEIKSSVDKNRVRLNEVFNFKIEIEGNINRGPEVKLPDLKEHFKILSSSQSQKIIRDSGKNNLIVVYQFMLQPKKIGEFTIEEAQIEFQGKIHKTPPIQIEVLPADESQDLPDEPQEIKSPDGGIFI
jgi:uncharacterized protein (DUF58 family)